MLRRLLSGLTAHLPPGASAVARTAALAVARRAVCLAGVVLVHSLAEAAGVTPLPADEVLDEVQVHGTRARIDELRQEMIRLEDEIYARYNDLNTIDKYDVICSDYARTGTRIERRYCRPLFEDRAKAEEGQVAFQSLQKIHDPIARVSPASVQLPESPVRKILEQMPAYQRHMRQIMEKDPQLQKLLRDRAAAAEQLQRAQRELFGR